MKFKREPCFTIVKKSMNSIRTCFLRYFLLAENPQFNESFEFEIAFPELALIRFVVLDDESLDYDFIGQCTLPFESIQSGNDESCYQLFELFFLGYRHVHLYTIAGELIANAHLFVHIVINRKSLTTVIQNHRFLLSSNIFF